ncbi:MAG: inositol monophosphatase family protein [Fimbriimonas sp.]
MPYPSPLLSSLGAVVQEAGALAVRMRKAGIEREIKSDGSIVTPADREVETFLRAQLVELYPDTNVWGEELGFATEGEGGLWLVDPIDGTSNFAFGSPLWGVSVALMRAGVLELGAVYLPDLEELYLAERGRGAFVNGQPLPPIPAGPIAPEELISYDDKLTRHRGNAGLPGKMRCSGAFVIDGTFTARQRYRGLVGFREKLYDVAACALIGLELGADIRYADGEAIVLSDLVIDQKIDRPWVIFPPENGFILPR